MPVFPFDKASDMARSVRAFLNQKSGATRSAAPGGKQSENLARNPEHREMIKSKRQELRSKKQEFKQIRQELRNAGKAGTFDKRRKKRAQQEIFQLERELHTSQERSEDKPVTGALPDFIVIGTKKGGTSFFYHLLTQHPHVEPAASKELHFFDALFGSESIEWYRQNFPQPRWKEGRMTITGEATPCMAHHLAPVRVAKVAPEARLIALLRNPVDRTYSDYQMVVRKGRETRSFEEAVGLDRDGKIPEREDRAGFDDNFAYLSRSIYVDQLLRWSEFFPQEQMLILKSEDFFESPRQILKPVLDFLDLPDWEPETPEFRDAREKDKHDRLKRNKGSYERGMAPVTRRRLQEFFESHNRRLYDFLGVDFGW